MAAISENPLSSSGDVESSPRADTTTLSVGGLAESNGVTTQLVEEIKKQVKLELLAEAEHGIGSPFSMGVRRTLAQLTQAPTNWQ